MATLQGARPLKIAMKTMFETYLSAKITALATELGLDTAPDDLKQITRIYRCRKYPSGTDQLPLMMIYALKANQNRTTHGPQKIAKYIIAVHVICWHQDNEETAEDLSDAYARAVLEVAVEHTSLGVTGVSPGSWWSFDQEFDAFLIPAEDKETSHYIAQSICWFEVTYTERNSPG